MVQKVLALDLTERVVAQDALANQEQSAERVEAVSAREAGMVVRARTVEVTAGRVMTSAKESVSVVEMIPSHRKKVEAVEAEGSRVALVVDKANVDHVAPRTIKPEMAAD